MATSTQQPQTINITTGTIVKTVAILLIVGFLWLIRDIVVIVLFSLILASAIDPIVDWLQKRRIPRAISVLAIFLLLVGAIAGIVTLLIPPIAEQISALAHQVPQLFSDERINLLQELKNTASNLQLTDSIRDFFSSVGTTLSNTTGGIFSTVSSFFGGIFTVISIAVLTFYLTAEEKGIKKFFHFIVPTKHREYTTDLIQRIQLKLGSWLRSYLVLALFVGILVYIGLTLIGVQYALVLALLAGILEFIPFIGPIVSTVPAAFFAIADSPVKAILVVVLYVVINQVEQHLIVPRLLHRTIGLNPVVIVLVLLVGAKLAGVIGLLLAVPLTIALVEFGRDVFDHGHLGTARFSRAKR
ncbi:MAG: AI-2E family transporter [Candidatus Andersenbacteria bacterium]